MTRITIDEVHFPRVFSPKVPRSPPVFSCEMGWSNEAAEASYRRRGQMTIDRAAIFEQFYGEMKKARERILTTADGEVGWLLKFI